MTQTEALRLALQALEEFCEYGTMLTPIERRDAIKAVLEAKDEPVAWLHRGKANGHLQAFTLEPPPSLKAECEPLYTHPQPVIDESAAKRIATTLGWEPKHEPLTDEQIAEISVECATVTPSDIYFARAIEAAHGIKGEA